MSLGGIGGPSNTGELPSVGKGTEGADPKRPRNPTDDKVSSTRGNVAERMDEQLSMGKAAERREIDNSVTMMVSGVRNVKASGPELLNQLENNKNKLENVSANLKAVQSEDIDESMKIVKESAETIDKITADLNEMYNKLSKIGRDLA